MGNEPCGQVVDTKRRLNVRYGTAWIILAGSLGLPACAPGQQQLTVQTVPRGAEVYLQRSGTIEVEANVAGVSGRIDAGSFQDDFFLVGTTPAEFKFPLTERDATVQGENAGGNVTRRYTQGLLRIMLPGYRTEERSVLFTGDAVKLELQLTPQ